MEIDTTNIAYALNAGKTVSVTVTLYGTDNIGNYVNSTVKVVSDDLADGKTFEQTSQFELGTIARNKLIELVAIK
ncbi:hypothetical protein [Liquorilactobacillus hordei]|uniref:Uncharacterized protein n=1 Tax=Liquorilactobacillus hordei DSM 19519 TaxID=1423759 RepID=A0A0R1MKB5_9LACO|nr:hypothetical protein [Liquorilactobacillus hordei]KRL07929.1 hypothetical protein FC92_GL000996 [Liquorilactobacillus hordei DSM 19519]QYH51125.1 hypothetical protein G6O70_00775 [Liquorilactobacillus hordei DSM 19519]